MSSGTTHLQNTPDDFIWLEEIKGETAVDWAIQQSKQTRREFAESERFEAIRDDVFDCLNASTQIPGVRKCGNLFYNFWQDEKNPRGLLRRTTFESYRRDAPEWETVLDIDALGEAEGQSWVYYGIQVLAPDYQHALLHLSPDGGDASAIREFDLTALTFVEDGFNLPAAKSRVSWIDRDRLFVATDFGQDSMTTSGYPRIAKIWQRGTPLEQAETQFVVEPNDMSVMVFHDDTQGFERKFVGRVIDFYHREVFLLDEEQGLLAIDVPQDAKFSTWRDWLLVSPASDWQVNGETYPSGSLLVTDFSDFMAGGRQFKSLFTPGATTTLDNYSMTRDYLILSVMDNVVNRLEVLKPEGGLWTREGLGDAPDLSKISASGIDDETNEFFMTVTGFLQPTSLYYGVLGEENGRTAEIIKQAPAYFDASAYQVTQNFVTSDDGTQVPYFVILAKDIPLDGTNPTILYGYGGFEISLDPYYLGVTGPAWLERGGVFVIANIRGGGEYGPRWHQSALKEKRLRAYEDFSSVAKDLIARKITSPAHLAAQGGSNGGLLVGNMLTRYPELFGAIICEVPLLDMQRYTQISAGASWIAEYGDPQKPEEWAYIQAFSPYHNIDPLKIYPPVLFSTATSDDRVGPGHARKMAAKMQQLGIENVYFYENTEGGHSAAADKAQNAFKRALVSEFLWRYLADK
ncbi:prolyl oligopeptidase family serine peptidase [Rouxiella sp. S1S-2]|uniref:prolyl oligopeptidase family serine peptidase n=1 Tax=Rouxiella sp. S1S-2 TaxID=2653856 RepID=UPI00126437A8|nr:prolyl oligopeptidase family serine peptidase [Rouxiella sp. S1S-2]KAB7897985.1 prolyl oligopeptidase family serine peptidase [Rouxiella sp. S1S-2]